MGNRFAFFASASATVLVVIVVSGAWILSFPRGPGAPNVGSWPILMPVLLVLLIAMWIVLRVILLKRIGWTALAVLGGSLVLAYLVTAAACGPVACFQAEPNRYMGWFIVIGTVLAALLHHVAYQSMTRNSNGG